MFLSHGGIYIFEGKFNKCSRNIFFGEVNFTNIGGEGDFEKYFLQNVSQGLRILGKGFLIF